MKKFFVVINIFVLFLISCDMFDVDVKDFFDIDNPLYKDEIIYTVAFNANGGSGTMESQTFTYGVEQNLRTNTFTSLTGQYFAGWATTSSATSAQYSDKQSVKNLTNEKEAIVNLYAVWSSVPVYIVTFHANNGSNNTTTQAFTQGTTQALMANTFTLLGHEFASWNTASDGSGTSYVDKTDYTTSADIDLYANWDINTYTVTFDPMGGIPTPAPAKVDYNNLMTMPTTPAKDYYIFAGWYTENTFANKWDFDNHTVTNDITLYAKWDANTNVWLDGEALASGDGSESLPYDNFSDARIALPEGGTIWVKGGVTITSGTHLWYSFNTKTQPLVLKRAEGFTGSFASVSADGSLTLQDITLDGQGGVVIDSNADGTPEFSGQGSINAEASLVSVGIGGELTIADDAILQNNKNIITDTELNTAGAIHAKGSDSANSASLNIEGGTIRYNTVSGDGGGLVVKGGTNFTMSGGTIEYNESINDGGAIHLTGKNTSFTMSDTALIQYNEATDLGGGIFVYSSSLTIENGTLKNNIATKGGAISLNDSAKLSIKSGSLTDNRANASADIEGLGGAIYALNSSTISMVDGRIMSNAAVHSSEVTKAKGGGIYLTETATIIISGTPEIKDNEAGTTASGSRSNLYFSNTSADTSSVTMNGNLVNFADSIGLSPKTAIDGHILVHNLGSFHLEENFFFMDDGKTQTHIDASGSLVVGDETASAYLTIEYYNGDNLASTADLETMIEVPVLDPTTGLPTGTTNKTIKDHQKEERFLNYGTWNEHKLEFTQAQFEALLIAAVAPVGTTVESFVDMMVEANSSILMEKVNTNTLRYNLAAQYLEVANTPPFEGEVAFWLGNTPADMSVEVDMNNDGTSDGQLSTFATYTGARLVDNILTGSFQTKPELEAFIAKYTGYHGGLSGSVIFIDVTGYVFATPPTSDPSDFDVDATGVITAYNGIDTDVVIPPMDKDGNAITGIGNNAFKDNTTLTSVEIPDGVATIGDSAFSGCYNIVTLEIPDSVNTIGESAFQNCSDLTTIEIPDSVTSIGDNTFDFCISLESVSIGDNVASIGASAFSGCSSLETIEIPDSVTSIGEFAFANCTNLETITLSNTLNSIGNYAFNFCNKLKNMTIPDSVTSIGEQAFYSTGLVSVIIPASVTSIGNSAFANTSSLISVVVEDANANYKSVANVVYSKDGTTLVGYWIQGTSFTTPAGVTTIKEYAFAFNSTLVSVTIEDGVTNIESYAFAYNSALTTITIPESVTTILSAFSDCDNLATVNTNYTKNADNRTQGGINQFPTTWFPSMNTDLFDADWVFIPTDLAKFTVASGEITGYSGTDTVIVIPSVDADSNPITMIGDSVFYTNAIIEKVIILDGIHTIDSQAFSSCPNLTAIQIPDSVTTIFGMTFYGSDALETVYTNEDKLAPPLSWSNTNNGLLFTVPWVPIP